jgi:hypothetical protein
MPASFLRLSTFLTQISMPKLINKKNLNTSAKTIRLSRVTNNTNNMKKDFIFPLIVGLVFGALLMIFWQFNVRLNGVRAAITQLDSATVQNTNSVNEIVNFINQATGGQQAANGQQAPAATTPAE